MKKLFLTILLLGLTSSCNASSKDKLIVLLDWFANPNHALLFVAQQQGYFKEQGLDVELIGPSDPSDPPKLVAAGKADIAVTYEPQFIEQVDNGLPLIRIGTLIDQPLDCLVVLKDSPIKSIADLKNKRIGYSTEGIDSMILKAMLAKNGVNINDVHRINVHYDLTQALLSKRVDAVTGMMRNFETIQMELAGHPGRIFLPELNGIPVYSELIFVANKNKISSPKFQHFLIALKKSADFLQKHPEESWKEFAKLHPELNDELNRRAWFLSLNYFTHSPEKFDEKKWLVFAEFMHKNNLIKKVQPISIYAVNLLKD